MSSVWRPGAVFPITGGYAGFNIYPGAEYEVVAPFTLPLQDQMLLMPGVEFNISGAGSMSLLGGVIQIGSNPSNRTDWSFQNGYNYDVLSVDLGGYGLRQFGTFSNYTAITGAINIPAGAATAAIGAGIAGYAKGASAIGANASNPVGVYGQGDSLATGALAWGMNHVTNDNGFATTIWGNESDINIGNVGTAAFAYNATGGSTVEPASGTYAFWVGALGQFEVPKLRWAKGFFSDDGAAMVGLEIGAAKVPGTVVSGSQPAYWYFNPALTGRVLGAQIEVDQTGSLVIAQTYESGGTLELIAGGPAGTGLPFLIAEKVGSAITGAFFGTSPIGKPTITGAKGGNTALASTILVLKNLGLANDATTA